MWLTFKGDFRGEKIFANKYVSLPVKLTTRLAWPLFFRKKLCFSDFVTSERQQLKLKTHPNFQLEKMWKKVGS
jgi:hypothetical protein